MIGLKDLFTLSAMAVGLMIFSSVPTACAWDDAGHETIAILAWQHLSPKERGEVLSILRNHPQYKTYLIKRKPPGADEGEYAFARAATWPDFVRPIKNKPGQMEDPEHVEITRLYHHPVWHYMDQIFSVPEGYNPHHLATKPENALTALDGAVAQLKSADTPPEQRAIALCWIEHLVGDIHQPLHAATMVSQDYPFGDTGGNAQSIRPKDEQGRPQEPKKLHAYWDELLGPLDEPYKQVRQRALTLKTPESDRFSKRLKEDKTPASWVQESFDDARSMVYLRGELKTAKSAQWSAGTISEEQIPVLPNGYEARARNLACERAAEASIRLEELLSRTLEHEHPESRP